MTLLLLLTLHMTLLLTLILQKTLLPNSVLNFENNYRSLES